jgi:hypothetical protein
MTATAATTTTAAAIHGFRTGARPVVKAISCPIFADNSDTKNTFENRNTDHGVEVRAIPAFVDKAVATLSRTLKFIEIGFIQNKFNRAALRGRPVQRALRTPQNFDSLNIEKLCVYRCYRNIVYIETGGCCKQ